MPGNKIGDISKARVLISNDDGVNAPGIKVLERAMKKIAREVWVVAPEHEQSAASHSLTLRMPLRIRKVSARRYGVDGTPTDSVLLGIKQVMAHCAPDLVLSGVNRGANLGEDVTYSGTVAAAMEGTLLGVPSIAFSLVTDDAKNPKWSCAEHWVGEVMKRFSSLSLPNGVLLNVNFPDVNAKDVTGIEVTRQGRRKIGGSFQEGRDPRGESYYWIGPQREEDRFKAGTDLEAVNRGAVSITPLGLDLTHTRTLGALNELV